LCIQPNEALWQASVIQGLDSTDLCVENELEFQFTNVQTGHSYNTQVRVEVPLNSVVEMDSIYIQYPSSGTSYLVPISAVQFNPPFEYIIYVDSVVPGLSENGLPGPLTSGQNNFRIRYNLELACDYISGSAIETSVFGQNACGSSTNVAGAPNQSVYVFGVPEPYFINPRVSSNDTLTVCNNNLVVRINMLKLGSNPIGANDSMRITLPLGASYVPGSINFLNNPLPQLEPTLDTIGSVVLNSWLLPTGVAELDSIDFTIELSVNENIDCGTPSIFIQTFVDNVAFCATLGANCGVKAQTGSREYGIDVIRPTISLSNSESFVLFAGANSSYEFETQLINSDLVNDIPSGLTYNIYCADNFGNPSGPIIYTGSMPAVPSGDTVLLNASFVSPIQCLTASGLSIQFERSATNCLCEGGFVIPLSSVPPIVTINDTAATEPGTPVVINVLANDSSFTSTLDSSKCWLLRFCTFKWYSYSCKP
jgi:hypothetical protein